MVWVSRVRIRVRVRVGVRARVRARASENITFRCTIYKLLLF